MATRKSTPKKKGKRRFTFEFSLAGLLSLALLAVMILVWIFIFGVLVGRGYRPEAWIPQLSRVLPGNTTPPPAVQARPGQPPQKYQVLKPEELDFFENLQKDTPPAASSKPSPAGVSPSRTAPATTEQPEKPSPVKDRFEFVYQLASFKTLDQARTYQARLKKDGIASFASTADVKGAPWYRVNVSFAGTEAEARHFIAGLEAKGVKGSFLRSKKPL